MSDKIKNFRELKVYKNAFGASMMIFNMTKRFPSEERYSMVDQIRKSSRSVCANLAEAWRKRRYKAHFISKLSDVEGEAEETRVWLEFSRECGYVTDEEFKKLDGIYDLVLGQVVLMISNPDKWVLR